MTDYTATEWRAAGACVTADPDLFFPIAARPMSQKRVRRAIRICASCEVRRQCLQFAMDVGETYGIWGGTTPEERLRAHRKELARRRSGRQASRRVASGLPAA